MHVFRRLVLNNPALAGFVLALALVMKLLMPAGFMPTVDNGHIVISICSGTGPMKVVMTIPGMEHGEGEDSGHHNKAEQPCAFTGLSLSSLAAADVVLLTAAIMFILALGMRPVAPLVTAATPYLRPPLRGPPKTV